MIFEAFNHRDLRGNMIATDLTLLKQLLENATKQTISESAAEEYFDQIVDCIEQEKTDEAAQMIEKVFSKGATDVRLIFYYLYTHFAKHGIKSFASTFPIITSVVNDYQNILLPENKIEKHIQNSLKWFFSHLLFRFKYYEKLMASGKTHPIWKKSIEDLSSEDLDHLISVCQGFRDFVFEKWPNFHSKDKVTHLLKKIEGLRHLVVENTRTSISEEKEVLEDTSTPVVEEISQPIEIEEESFTDDSDQEFPQEQQVEEKCEGMSESGDEDTDQNELPSPPPIQEIAPIDSTLGDELHDFSRKMHLFETLIAKHDYLKAAVVAKDIDHLIETFDPLNYFPKLFSKYFSILAKHVAAITEQHKNQDSLQVKALERLYRTDFDMFVDW
jgi:hypothetical protein